MDDKLQKLEKILNAFDKNTITEEDFVASFKLVTDFIKQSNNATAQVLEEVFGRLDTFAEKLKGDTDQDRKLVKQAVGQAMAELRIGLDDQGASQNAKIDARLAHLKDGEPGKAADPEAILEEVLKRIPPASALEPETPNGIVEKVNKSSLMIMKERIEGLVDALRMAGANANSMPITTMFVNGKRGKNITFNNAISNGTDTINISIPVQPNAPSNPTLNQLWIDST